MAGSDGETDKTEDEEDIDIYDERVQEGMKTELLVEQVRSGYFD